MNSFIVAINAVLPLFLIIAAGYLARRAGLLHPEALNGLNRFVFAVLLSAKMFISVYSSDMSAGSPGKLLAFILISTLLSYLAFYVLVLRVEKEDAKRGVMIQALYRSNFIILGVPVAVALTGESCSGTAAAVAAAAVPLGNVLAVFTLQRFNPSHNGAGGLMKKICTNPLILGTLAGLLLRLMRVPLPRALLSAVSSLSSAATPMALIVLGGFFQLGSLRESKRALTLCLAGKLLAAPAVMLAIAVALGFRGPELAVVLAYYATPCGPSCFTMACELGGDLSLANNTVVVGSLCSAVTLTLLSSLLMQLGYL